MGRRGVRARDIEHISTRRESSSRWKRRVKLSALDINVRACGLALNPFSEWPTNPTK